MMMMMSPSCTAQVPAKAHRFEEEDGEFD